MENKQHWNNRAESVKDDVAVNLMDVFQRELEYEYVCRHLKEDMRVLEVGCGNGYSTKRFRPLVKQIDAFDCSEQMVNRAKKSVGETNNRFFTDDVLDPQRIQGVYDAVICVRVLINLRNLDEQKRALQNLIGLIKPKGSLILAEGFTDGFTELNSLRLQVGMPALTPAKINFYSSIDDLLPGIESKMTLEAKYHLGMYDYLTRVVYPLVVGPENVIHNSEFSKKSMELAKINNPYFFERFSRMRIFVYTKRGTSK